MSRNSSGNYTLPTGNPVVPGTTISTVWANATLGDLSSEMTDSLNRSGKGAMLAPLKATDGTVAAPSLTFANDPDSGLYRVSDNVVAVGANATQVQRWTPTGTTVPGTAAVGGAVTVTGAGSFAAGVVVTNTTTNGNGISVTANGTGVGLDGTGGATSGYGVRGNGGAPNGQGVVGMGAGAGYGVEGVGGPDGGGGIFTPGTTSTAAVRSNAVVAYTGDILFSTVTNPNSDVAMTNRLTPANVVKAWAVVTKAALGGVTITSGFNVASISASTITATITFASAFANTNYAVVVTAGGDAPFAFWSNVTGTTTVAIKGRNLASGALPLSELNFEGASGNPILFHIVAIGAQ